MANRKGPGQGTVLSGFGQSGAAAPQTGGLFSSQPTSGAGLFGAKPPENRSLFGSTQAGMFLQIYKIIYWWKHCVWLLSN